MSFLSACGTSGAGIGGRPDQVQVALPPICPVPTRWTQSQNIAVAGSIERHSQDSRVTLLATEWDRLNEASKICWGEP